LIPSLKKERQKPRYSIAYFSGPDTHEVVQPLAIKLTPEEEKMLEKVGKHYDDEPFSALDYTLNKVKIATQNTYA